MSALAYRLRCIADHLDPEGSAERIRAKAITDVLKAPVRHILNLKRDALAESKAIAKSLELPNLTGK